jgi:hypothetical protein
MLICLTYFCSSIKCGKSPTDIFFNFIKYVGMSLVL